MATPPRLPPPPGQPSPPSATSTPPPQLAPPRSPFLGNARGGSPAPEPKTPISDPKLNTLVMRVQAGASSVEETVQLLDSIRAAAKGDDTTKSLIGEHLIPTLMKLVSSHQTEPHAALAAAKLLRSITVSKRNKDRLGPFCRTILKIVSAASAQLQIPLAAILWNMSSIPPNRELLIREGVLVVLSDLLARNPAGGEVQTEAAGATRNFTLDERYLGEFSRTNMIETLVGLVPAANNPSLLACVLVALRNISTNPENQPKLATPASIANLISALRRPSQNPLQDHKYILETLANLSNSPLFQPVIARAGATDLLLQIASAKIDQLSMPATLILKNIAGSANSDRSVKARIDEALHSNDLVEQSTEDGYVSKLLERLQQDEAPIQPKDVLLKKQIGEGAYGSVYLAEYHGYPVACKIIKAGLNRTNAEKLLDELRLMRKLKHPNVVLLMGACLNEEKQIMILTEFVSRGDLKKVLEDITSISKRMRICQDVAQGLSWLGSHKIVHRDLKLDNLLVTEDWSVKITDFGLSIENDEGQIHDRFGGNVKYSAPEILRERFVTKSHAYAYGEQTDVYSFGLIWWQVLTKQDPFRKRPPEYKGKEGLVQFILEDHRPALPRRWPKSLTDAITACWSGNPARRPTFRQLLEHWDTLTLDLLCPDELAQTVCRALWGYDQKRKVPLEELLNVFQKTCLPNARLSPKDEKYLEELLRDSNFDDTVAFDRFCYVVSWFGPLDAATNSAAFLRRLNDTLGQECFHGFLTNQKSDGLLVAALQSQNKPQPYYLVKYSFDSMGEFILTFITADGKVNYVKIRNIAGFWQIGTSPKQYDNWATMQQVCKQVIGIGSHVPAKR